MKISLFYCFTSIPTKLIVLLVCLLLCTCQLVDSQVNKPIDSLKEVLKNRSKEGLSAAEKAKLLIELSTSYAGVNQDSLFYYANQVLKLSSNQGMHTERILGLRNLGFYYSEKGANTKALRYYDQAEKICLEEGLGENRADLLRLKGDEYYFLGDFENSLASLLLAIELSKELDSNNYLILSIAYRNVGRLYSAQQDYTSALEFHQKAVKANTRLQNERVSAITFAQMADIYNKIGAIEKARKHALKSHHYFKEENHLRWLAYCKRILGDSYRLDHDYPTAIQWLNDALLDHESLDDQREEAKILLSLARSHLGQGDVTTAENKALRAQSASAHVLDIQIQKELAEVFYKISKTQGDTSDALTYHQEFKALNDSLFTINNSRALSLYKGKLQFEKEKEQVVIDADKKVAKSRNLLISSMILVLVLFGLIVPLYLKEKKLRELNRELAQKTDFLQKKESELRAANESKNIIFSILGHDLKSPISTLHNALELYSDRVISKEELLKNLPSLRSGVNQILLTLNNLLTWSSGQLNGPRRQASEFNIRSVVEQNIDFLKETARLKGIDIKNEIPEPFVVIADRNQTSLIIRNILDNAIKYTPMNGQPIRFKAFRKDDCIEITLKDHGVGIDPEKLKTINKNQPLISTVGTNKEKGTGLGLGLCKEMIAVNEGQIIFQSKPGQGTIISIRLPSPKKLLNRPLKKQKATHGAA